MPSAPKLSKITSALVAATGLTALASTGLYPTGKSVYVNDVLVSSHHNLWGFVHGSLMVLAAALAVIAIVAHRRGNPKLGERSLAAAAVASIPAIVPALIGLIAWARMKQETNR
ncbi:hypothetical protein ACNAW0_20585 [Micromonospora sp. SL1-18]|uniref:hypothetical protein n=1 Tax=Micromonospora sp. SL1-18 TaxID=3399128 RepID=UPI003A4E2B01